ncbi:MAG: PilZ domain-containing protein [Candidatus Baltobacteraceae bacterium]
MADERSPAQQRQYYRAPVDFAVAATRADDDAVLASRAHDLSGAGMRLSMDRDLSKGQVLELHFRLPTGAPEIKAFGLIVLSYFEGSSGRYYHGIAFTRISASDQEAIVHYIHEVQQRSLKN